MILTVNSRIRDLENHSIYLLLKCCKNLSWLSFRSVFIIFNFKLQISEEENYNVEKKKKGNVMIVRERRSCQIWLLITRLFYRLMIFSLLFCKFVPFLLFLVVDQLFLNSFPISLSSKIFGTRLIRRRLHFWKNNFGIKILEEKE